MRQSRIDAQGWLEMMEEPLTTDQSHDAQPAAGVGTNPLEPAGHDLNAGRDTLDYIMQLTGELAILARDSRFDLVAYFLEMAAMEAGSTRRKLTRS